MGHFSNIKVSVLGRFLEVSRQKTQPFSYTLFLQHQKDTIEIMLTNLKLMPNVKNNSMIPCIIIKIIIKNHFIRVIPYAS